MQTYIKKSLLISIIFFSNTTLYACSCDGAKTYAKELHLNKDELPPHKLVRLALECTGIMSYVKHLDILDQDLIYMKATYKTKSEYAESLTTNSRSRKFSDIIPQKNIDNLYTLISNIY